MGDYYARLQAVKKAVDAMTITSAKCFTVADGDAAGIAVGQGDEKMNENKILAAVARSLNKTHDAISGPMRSGRWHASICIAQCWKRALRRADCDEAALKSVQERIQRQEKREAMLAGMDPQNRQTFNALYEENRARYAGC
jgi:hypothetical protein